MSAEEPILPQPGYAATQIREKKPHPRIWMGGPRHRPRLTKAQRRKIINACIESDGPICRATVCLHTRVEDLTGKPPDAQYHIFSVDHIDGNAANNWFDNHQICHGDCNNADRYKVEPPQTDYLLHGLEREKNAGAQLHTSVDLPSIAYTDNVPLAIRLNFDHEIAYRKYCFKRVLEAIKKGEYVTKKVLRPNAREVSGAGLASSYSYQERLFADGEGPLIEDVDHYDNKKGGSKFIRFRNPEDSRLTPDELMEKYPKIGKSREPEADA